MRKVQGVDDLASRITAAATAPLMSRPPNPAEEQPARRKKAATMSVFLRMPADLHASLEEEAVARTKATGKGVTVQQIILEKLGGKA
jgi:hypothetical protein